MGITIHYHGRIKDMARLPELASELKAACHASDWPYLEINERIIGTAERLRCVPDPQEENTFHVVTDVEPVDDRWQGLAIQPPGCETLYLAFNREGQLVVYDARFNSSPGAYQVTTLMFCKTQFGLPETHMAICGLLRLAQPYMAEWEVEDEGNYWESGDEEELRKRLGQMGDIIQQLAGEAGRETLEEILGENIEGRIEVGKWITTMSPIWRKDWGSSAHEN